VDETLGSLTLLVGYQEGHTAYMKTSATYLDLFWNKWRKKTEGEMANPGSLGKRPLKQS